jgi:membrane protein involved in colicin uptake
VSQYIETFADGTLIERPWTEEELAQQAKDAKAYAAAEKAKAKADAEAATARADAIAHAKSLGFTDAMIAVMYPGLMA